MLLLAWITELFAIELNYLQKIRYPKAQQEQSKAKSQNLKEHFISFLEKNLNKLNEKCIFQILQDH